MAACRFNVIVRALSSSAVQQQLVKPPVQLFTLEGRYASALYSAASKQKQLEVVEKDILKFEGLFKTDVRLREFILDPTIKRPLKVEAMKQVASKAALSPQTSNILALLAENGRLMRLTKVINSFKLIMAAHRGELHCEVVTAKPLDEALKKELEAALKGFLKQGHVLILKSKVDPNLIGGMVVSIGDKYIDMSISSKVKKYTELLEIPA